MIIQPDGNLGSSQDTEYRNAVDYLEELPSRTKKNPPEHTRELLHRLGDPQDDLRIIHVAGTNGKGSVSAFLEAMLSQAHYRTGLFTSPHLVTIRERFQLCRKNISRERFLQVFEKVRSAVDAMQAEGLAHPAYFEMLLAMGLLFFSEEKTDYLVMETGLGGRTDATSAVRHPVLSVITSISFDHTEYLGGTIEEIAYHKAGIIRPGVPVVFDAGNEAASKVIRREAILKGSEYTECRPDMVRVVSHTDKSIAFILNNRYYVDRKVTVPFAAPYQVMNAALALTALRVLDPGRELICDDDAVLAVSRTRWSGRMESVLPGVILDGAHNEDGIEQFLKTVEAVQKSRPVTLLFAAAAEKNYEEMIRKICERGCFLNITVTQVEGKRKVNAEIFAALFSRYTSVPVKAVPSVEEAFLNALKARPEGGILFCAGSLYMAGDILRIVRQLKETGQIQA